MLRALLNWLRGEFWHAEQFKLARRKLRKTQEA